MGWYDGVVETRAEAASPDSSTGSPAVLVEVAANADGSEQAGFCSQMVIKSLVNW